VSAHLLWDLRPEWKLEHARQSVKDTLGLVRELVDAEAALLRGCLADEADAVEEMGLRLKIAAVNLCGAAARLREIEAERRVLARRREQEELRFEREPQENGRECNPALQEERRVA
jgi:hypothetical protein